MTSSRDARDARDAPDDVDRVFARLAPLPAPRSFVPDVLRAVRRDAATGPAGAPAAVPAPGQLWGWGAVVAGALVGVLALAFLAGQALVGGGALDLLAVSVAVSLGGAEGAADLRGLALLGLADAFPWLEVLGLLATLALLAYGARRLGRGDSAHRTPGSRVAGAA